MYNTKFVALVILLTFLFHGVFIHHGWAEPENTDLPKSGQVESFISQDDGFIRAGQQWPDERFTQDGETMIDNLTNLRWLKDGICASGGPGGIKYANISIQIANFNAAPSDYCPNFEEAHKGDWRLPTIVELMSLMHVAPNVATKECGEWLIFEGFSNIVNEYWTSTLDAKDTNYAWYLNTNYGIPYREQLLGNLTPGRYQLLLVKEDLLDN